MRRQRDLFDGDRGRQAGLVNARFWVYENDGYVKVTVYALRKRNRRLGSVSWRKSGRTDEGWARRDVTWELDSGIVREYCRYAETDCDGRHEHITTMQCDLDSLLAMRPYWEPGEMLPPDLPRWKYCETRERDFYAEAAGY